MDEEMPSFTGLVTSKELAELLRTSTARVRQLANSSQIPYVRISERRLLFDPVKVYRALEHDSAVHTAAPVAAAPDLPQPAPVAKANPSPRPAASRWGKPNPRRDRG